MKTHARRPITGFRRLALVAASAFAAVSASAADAIVLKYANFPPAPTFPCVQMERWKTEIEKRTDGKVKVQTYPGGTLLGAKNMVDGVEAGTADIGCFAMSYQPGRFPVSEAVDLPLGFGTGKGASQALFDLIMERKPAEFGEGEADHPVHLPARKPDDQQTREGPRRPQRDGTAGVGDGRGCAEGDGRRANRHATVARRLTPSRRGS